MGQFIVTCKKSDGTPKWQKHFSNVMSDQGIAYMLKAAFEGATRPTSYLVLLNSNSVPTTGDTYASPGFIEVTTDVSNAARRGWNPSVSAKTVVGTASYTSAGYFTLWGACVLVSGSATKGDKANSSGRFIAGGLFDSEEYAEPADVIDVTYTLTF